MNRYIVFIALMIGLLLATFPNATFGDVSSDEQNSDVSMTITKFYVDDQILELGFKIMNNSDHDVWICDGLTAGNSFDLFLDQDNETLKIMKRSDLPDRQGWEHYPWIRFIRLHPGQNKEGSISLTVPVSPQTKFGHSFGNAKYARRVAIEIDYFDEDLRGLILNIVDLTERLNCDISLLSTVVAPESQILERFFAGVYITQIFHDESFRGFQNKVLSDGDEISMPFMGQLFHGEKVLRATIDGVSIPYKSNYPQLNEEPAQDETEPAEVTMALTGFDVNDTHLELSWNIKNNTDHDVWICNGYERSNGSIRYFERFIDKDNKTLILRRRYNLTLTWLERNAIPRNFRYLRLSPGQEKIESHSFTLPVTSINLFHAPGEGRLNVESAQHMAIEIGFYDEDLRALILGVVEIAESLSCNDSAVLAAESETPRLFYRFFGGFEIAGWFKNRAFFRNSVTSDGDEILMGHMHQSLNGEQVLRIEVNNLSIPFSIFY